MRSQAGEVGPATCPLVRMKGHALPYANAHAGNRSIFDTILDRRPDRAIEGGWGGRKWGVGVDLGDVNLNELDVTIGRFNLRGEELQTTLPKIPRRL